MPTAVPYHRDSDNETDTESEGHTSPTREEYAVFSRDGSPASVEELEAEEFPTYFSERDGRLFHASATSPYPLPVDGPEHERLNALNALVRDMMGANYIADGPVPDILAHDSNSQKHVLDLCTGTGTWVMEMAEGFPHVLFTGIDVVPIATRYPLPNVTFEIGDITEELRWQEPTFDFVHARDILLSVHDYTTILPEVVRVMRTGGVFFSGEWDLAVLRQPGLPQAANTAPSSTQYYEVLNDALHSRGIQSVIHQIPTYLHNTGNFHHIQPSVMYVPIGRWHDDPRLKDLGGRLQWVQSRFADSTKPFLREIGHTQAYVDALVQNFVDELGTVDGLVGAYHMVHAIKA